MVNARPGYWDVDRCVWVGVEPTDGVPLIRSGDHAPERVPSETSLDLPTARDVPADDAPAPAS